MCYECVVGLKIIDDSVYDKYREAMKPILATFGGGFRYDFSISKVLKSETDNLINRVFLIYFTSEESMNQFFLHPDYLTIKNKFFKKSVEATTIISQYERS
jgi:uncharacterized protein (DUF1330 family)